MNPNHDYDTAIHEAGHSVCASHFRIPAFPEILNGGESVVSQTTHPDYAGMCSYDDGPMTPFEHAVLSWAGPMAQCLYGTPLSWAPPYKPTVPLLRDWHSAMLVQMKRFSAGDRAGLVAGYKFSWRACKTAYRITKKNKARIIRLAKAMLTGGSAASSVPLPEKFPATFADFLGLVVSADEPETKFRDYIFDRTQKSFADRQFRFETPEQQQQAVESWTAGRLEKFRAGFITAELWQDEARGFRDWTKSKNSTDQTT